MEGLDVVVTQLLFYKQRQMTPTDSFILLLNTLSKHSMHEK